MRLHFSIIRILSPLIPRRFRSDWKQEWEAELHNREWRGRPDVFRRSLGAFWDALAMQSRRLEEETFQDLRYGFRTLKKSPVFAGIVILALTIGIGMNTAIFSIVNAALLEPLPYKEADQVVRVLETTRTISGGLSPLDYLDWKEQNLAFTGIAAFEGGALKLSTPEGLERVSALRVSSDFMPLLGAEPLMGRSFLPAEDRPGSNRIVILSHAAWGKFFGNDPGIVGRVVTLDGQRVEVIGVMDAQFGAGPVPAEAWVPLRLGEDTQRMRRTERYLNALARIRLGVSFDAAQKEMDLIAARIAAEFPVNAGVGVRLVPLRDTLVGSVRDQLRLLLAAVGMVLLIACCNCATLLLLRSTSRQREVTIRLAVGARRLRIVRQLLTEVGILTCISALAGTLVAYWTLQGAIPFLKTIGPLAFAATRAEQIGLNWPVLIFALLISVACTFISGLIPAVRSTSSLNLAELRESVGSSSTRVRSAVRDILVVAEVSLTLVLLVGAGLLIGSLIRVLQVDLGFNPDRILTVAFSPMGSPEERFHRDLIDQIRKLPGVEAASLVNHLPSQGVANGTRFTLEDRPPSSASDVLLSSYRIVGTGYFATIGARLSGGREFNDRDTGQAEPVVIINETMARTFWPGEDPLGRRIRRGGLDGLGPWLRIIGIVRDVDIYGPGSTATTPRTEIYFPHAQFPMPAMTLVIKTGSDPLMLTNSIRAQIRSIDKNVTVSNIQTMDQVLSRITAPRRLNVLLLSVFSGVALLLASIGVYGVVSFSVAQRTHEIGIRTALGANRTHIVRLVVREGWRPGLIGIAAGIAGAIALSRWYASLLFGVSPTDFTTIAVVALLELSVLIVACYMPARKATSVDPLMALKHP
jgi:putative ABC transport system permease protein